MLPKLKQKKENQERQKGAGAQGEVTTGLSKKMGVRDGGPSVGNSFEYNIYGLE